VKTAATPTTQMLIVEGDLNPSMIKTMCVLPEDPLILEIGAHHGEDSRAFLDAFPNCRLHAFEADPRCLLKLRRALGHDRRCKIHACAVAHTSGFMPWYQSGGTPDGNRLDWDYSSSLLRPSGHLSVYPWCTFERKIEVQVVALDKLMFGDVDFIWMDVQGAEHLVFQGAINTLQRTRYLYTEYYDRPMYEGQKNLEEIRQMLPNFDVVALFARDECRNALFRANVTGSIACRP